MRIERKRYVVMRNNRTEIWCGLSRNFSFRPITELNDVAIKTYRSEAQAESGCSSWDRNFEIVPVIETITNGDDAPVHSAEISMHNWANRVRELDELYTKIRVVTGFTAEQLLEMFAAGYTLEGPDYSKPHTELANLAGSAPSNEPLTLEFDVVDTKTGQYPDWEHIARTEDWADGLVYCDIDGIAILEDGSLILLDECGNCAPCPRDRFEIRRPLERKD